MQPIFGSKHWLPPQVQTGVGWLFAGAQPHAPIAQLSGNSLAEVQHDDEPTVPPVEVQSVSRLEPEGVASPALASVGAAASAVGVDESPAGAAESPPGAASNAEPPTGELLLELEQATRAEAARAKINDEP